MSTFHGLSALPGSLNPKSSLATLPDWHAVARAPLTVMSPTFGATLDDLQSNESVTLLVPSLAWTVTEPEPSSFGVWLHDQVPSWLSTTVPSPESFEMVRVLFPSSSEKAPWVFSVSPSLPCASCAAVATMGWCETGADWKNQPRNS